jgi:hypothetical protein
MAAEMAQPYTQASPAASQVHFLALVLPSSSSWNASRAAAEPVEWRTDTHREAVQHIPVRTLGDRQDIADGVSKAGIYCGVGHAKATCLAHFAVVYVGGLDARYGMRR